MGGERGSGSEGEVGVMITIDEARQYLQNGYLRQLRWVVKMYEAEMRLGETMHNAYEDFAAQVGRPPLSNEEKKQAFLDYVLEREELGL